MQATIRQNFTTLFRLNLWWKLVPSNSCISLVNWAAQQKYSSASTSFGFDWIIRCNVPFAQHSITIARQASERWNQIKHNREQKKRSSNNVQFPKNSVEYAREIVDRDYIPKILNQTGENSTDKWKSAQRNYSKLKSKNLATINASAIEALKNNSIQLIIKYHNSFFKYSIFFRRKSKGIHKKITKIRQIL